MTATTEQITEAWNTVLFDKWCHFRHLVTVGLSPHGERALAVAALPSGARVLDVGCGFGDTTFEIARRVGPSGTAVGVDCAPNFVTDCSGTAADQGIEHAEFFVADVQVEDLRGPYDAAFSRFGTMFFNFPGAALRNICRSLQPGGELTMAVWRNRQENAWLYEAEQCVREIVPVVDPGTSSQPTCGPGPFSMAGPDLVSEMLTGAGFERIRFERFDAPICVGRDLDEAVDFAIQLGPAGEIVRLAGAEGERLRPQVTAALRERLGRRLTSGGVYADSSVWIVQARRPF